jgi:hypothetical protein
VCGFDSLVEVLAFDPEAALQLPQVPRGEVELWMHMFG